MRLNAVGLLSPIYPSEETTPLLICWTPPPVYYTIAYIVGYHINLTDSTNNQVIQHMFLDNETLCWKLTSFRNTTTLFSIAAEYVAGLGQTREILVSTPASECTYDFEFCEARTVTFYSSLPLLHNQHTHAYVHTVHTVLNPCIQKMDKMNKFIHLTNF